MRNNRYFNFLFKKKEENKEKVDFRKKNISEELQKPESSLERKEEFNNTYLNFYSNNEAVSNNKEITVERLNTKKDTIEKLDKVLVEETNRGINELLSNAICIVFLFSFLFISSQENDSSEYVESIKFDSLEVVTLKKLNIYDYENLFKLHNEDYNIQIEYNELLGSEIKKFSKYKWIPRVFSLLRYYEPLFESIFNSYSMPTEFKYLAVVESNLNPRAVSSVGAMGIWQFMPLTGKEYGLYRNSYINSFYDPYESTISAALFLKALYKKFQDWNLAISAYNCGAGNVDKAIRKAGTKSYWKVRQFLPKETRDYVLRYHSIKYLDHYYDNYFPYRYEFGVNFSNVNQFIVNSNTNFNELAYVNNLDLQELYFLNPQIMTEDILGGSYVYYIK